MNKLRIGIVGVGHLGRYHLQKYLLLDECELVAIADIDHEKADTIGATYGIPVYYDHRDLRGKVDAVSIAVPTVSHYEVAKDLLQAGIDCFVEKPITPTVAEADILIRLAGEQGRILQVGHIERFNPAVVALKTVLKRPLFIEAHRLHPFFERAADVDVILDLMIHDLDILLHLVGDDIAHVESVGVPVLTDKIDIANVRLVFERGCVANLTASRITNKTMRKIRFFGEEGYHAVDYEKRSILSLKRDRDAAGRPIIVENKLDVVPADPLEMEVRSFVAACRSRSRPAVPGEEARAALALATQIVTTMKTPS